MSSPSVVLGGGFWVALVVVVAAVALPASPGAIGIGLGALPRGFPLSTPIPRASSRVQGFSF